MKLKNIQHHGFLFALNKGVQYEADVFEVDIWNHLDCHAYGGGHSTQVLSGLRRTLVNRIGKLADRWEICGFYVGQSKQFGGNCCE